MLFYETSALKITAKVTSPYFCNLHAAVAKKHVKYILFLLYEYIYNVRHFAMSSDFFLFRYLKKYKYLRVTQCNRLCSFLLFNNLLQQNGFLY